MQKNKNILTDKQQMANKDLKIIIFATIIPVVIYLVFGNKIMEFVKINDVNVWVKGLLVALVQFGMAGFGTLVVILYRKEKLKDYGLVRKNIIKTILLSILVCIPHFIFLLVNNEVNSYFPLYGSYITKIFLTETFPTNVIGYILAAVMVGFFEGFNYVVVAKKINERYISSNKWLNYGAIVCGIICVLIHGMIGIDLYTVFEAITAFIIIYGMLVIKDNTENAWGCILIFLLFWNAIY